MIESLISLTKQYIHGGDFVSAEAVCLEILECDPEQPDALFFLGVISRALGDIELAANFFEVAIESRPDEAIFHFNLGLAYKDLEFIEKAEICFRQSVALNPEYAPAYQQLGQLLNFSKRIDEASLAYQYAIKLGLTDHSLLFEYATILKNQNQTRKAVDLFADIYEHNSNDLRALIHSRLTVPALYEDDNEIQYWRNNYSDGLEQIHQLLDLSQLSPQVKREAFSQFTPFYLAYQGKDDRALQANFGELIHQIMASNFPAWSRSVPMPPVEQKIRVGYVSSFMRYHTVSKLMLGWLRYADRESFEIYCYHTGGHSDETTEDYRNLSHRFYNLPGQLELTCQQIHTDRLHILVFFDIGMDALPGLIAALRLAPIQCTTWAHPVTTGLPTIDYFLSSDLMETEGSEAHYTETLIRLPKLGIVYPEPVLPSRCKTRSELGLPEDRIIYLCCQSLFKYLPQHDHIFAEIAQRVPKAVFVFLSHQSGGEQINNQFKNRLHISFSKANLDDQNHLCFLPRLTWDDYLSLNLVSDIFLDSMEWSGGNTTLEAVACSLPIVTCPGNYLRGRHSYAILRCLEISETIADNEKTYIDIAVRLGLDQEFRATISEQMKKRKHLVFNDTSPLRALETFFRESVDSMVDDSAGRV